jgi:hypothetical protein
MSSSAALLPPMIYIFAPVRSHPNIRAMERMVEAIAEPEKKPKSRTKRKARVIAKRR